MLTQLIYLAIGAAIYGVLKTTTQYAPLAACSVFILKQRPLNFIAYGMTAGASVDLASHLLTGNFEFLHPTPPPTGTTTTL